MKYKNLYILGDSLSDTGALSGILNDILGVVKGEFHFLEWVKRIYFSPPFYQGRSFSNGPLAVEHLAKKLELPLKSGWNFHVTPELKHWILNQRYVEFFASVEGFIDVAKEDFERFIGLSKQIKRDSISHTPKDQIGTNYSVANARASTGDSLPYTLLFNQFQLKNQLNSLINHHPDIGKEDLFFIMIGGNDVKEAVFNEKKSAKIIDESIDNIHYVLTDLTTRNIQHIVVAYVPDIGKTPKFLIGNKEKKELATKLSKKFNSKLENRVKSFSNVSIFNLARVFEEIISDYNKKGYNTTDACISDFTDHQNLLTLLDILFKGEFEAHYNSGYDQESLKNHLFFNSFHPTGKASETLGNKLYELLLCVSKK